MSSISSIDTSIYSGIIEDLSSYTPSRTALDSKTPAVTREDSSTVDLSNYYSNIRPEDLLANAGENVAKSAEDLDNAILVCFNKMYQIKYIEDDHIIWVIVYVRIIHFRSIFLYYSEHSI